MRQVIFNFLLFVVFCISFSALTACSGSSNPPAAGNETSQSSPKVPSNAGDTKKTSEYPLISSAVAQSDLKNLDGSTFKVSDKKGSVVLLNLWATWCGPCRSEMPTLVAMQDKYRDKQFQILGLNTDDEPASVITSFGNEMKLNYPLVWADNVLQGELVGISRFGGIPQSFLIDREGRLRGVFRGANPNDIRKMEEVVDTVVNQ